MKDNASELSKEDRERYEKQASKVQEIVAVFEKSDYSDENPEYQMQILHLMNEVRGAVFPRPLSATPALTFVDHLVQMQSYGSPPAEIMGEMPPGIVRKVFFLSCLLADNFRRAWEMTA